jgi:hypothetical protein
MPQPTTLLRAYEEEKGHGKEVVVKGGEKKG